MSSHLYQLSEDDLAALESNLALIYREGGGWPLFNTRPDIREAWQMTIKTLSGIRFMGGPPLEVINLPAAG